MKHALRLTMINALALAALGMAGSLHAADSATSAPAADTPAEKQQGTDTLEKVNVENIKEKYWAQGNESELGVVQNRTYSKDRKVELGVFGSALTTDPFLNVRTLGASAGFHFSEYFALRVIGWKTYVTPSSALNTFQDTLGATTNYNSPKSYFGLDSNWSVIYGKLSLLGQAIIYYDLHLAGGLGMTSTDTGRYLTPSLGLGQKIHLSRFFALRFDYRLMRYNETIKERVIPTKIGQTVGERVNWTNAIILGVDFSFGVTK